MVNFPPDPNESSSRRRDIGFDEIIALVVAFLSIGAILLWGLTRGGGMRQLSFSNLSEQLTRSPFSLDTRTDEEPSDLAPDAEVPAGIAGTAVRPGQGERLDRGRMAPDETSVQPLTIPSPQVTSTADQAAPSPESPAPEETATPAAEPESVTGSPPPLSIADVSEDYWAYPFIKGMYEEGLLPDFPSGQFEPDKPLTRAELAALINESLLDGESGAQPAGFPDVPNGYWAQDAIAQVVEANFMSGYSEGDFRPNELVPRYQVLVALASGLGLRPVNDPQATLQQFIDTNAIPDWARPQIAAAAETGLVVNHPNLDQVRPQEPATRAEIVAMIYQALEETGRVEPVQSQYAVPASQ